MKGLVNQSKIEQSKTVTPNTSGQTVTPDSGKVLSSVIINGDADLVSANIKSGINIFGVTGSAKTAGHYEEGSCTPVKTIERVYQFTITFANEPLMVSLIGTTTVTVSMVIDLVNAIKYGTYRTSSAISVVTSAITYTYDSGTKTLVVTIDMDRWDGGAGAVHWNAIEV